MRVAVNTRVFPPEYLEISGYFIYEIFKSLSNKFPEHEFIFIYDKRDSKLPISSPNVQYIADSPLSNHPLLLKYWYDVKLPRVLKKYKVDIFISFEFCSLITKTPQCLIVPDLTLLHYPFKIKKSYLAFYKRYFPKSLQKAKSIATISEFSKQDIISQYQIEKGKINVVHIAARESFKPMTVNVTEATKDKYAGGREYFLYVGGSHSEKNIVNLLKAFSIFKKRQKSNFKLVLAGRPYPMYNVSVIDLENYKYRSDVIMLEHLSENELVELMGSAYAFVYPSLSEGFNTAVIEAMKCNVPLITSLNSPVKEIAKDAALYFDEENFEDIGEKMMFIYKDENLRKQLIERGKIIARQYSWERTTELLWQTILRAVY